MCGIVAYIGHQDAYPILIKGLKRLEYRGYDSAGIALFDGSDLKVSKTKGKVVDLQNRLEKEISIEHQDFTSLKTNKIYDGAVMIEAIEHVGKDNLSDFLTEVSKRLKPNAPFYLQFTGRYKPKLVDPWTL